MQTVDFFTPIVDDPYDFGRIAAANSLSDVYAMGGKPLTALNIACFPQSKLDISVLQEVLRGGMDIMHLAGVVLLGGHTIDDPELKYGLAVTGIIHPDMVIHSQGVKAGNRLILTKPLGTGIVSTAIKNGKATPEAIEAIVRSMTTLNRAASEAMLEVGVSACKDVTGFGLLGHAAEMVEGADVGLAIDAAAVPVFPGTKELTEAGMKAGGLGRNRDFRGHMVDMADSVPGYLADILWDPQTSGGLLISVPREKAWMLLEALQTAGVAEATIIGEALAEPAGRIRVA